MAALVIVDIEITDPVHYEEYKRLAAPTVAAFGGRYVVRGGRTEVLEGDWRPDRLVVLEFPSIERAQEWWNSPEYTRARGIRTACARADMVVAEAL